jgi:hypothetical protein
MNLEKRMNVIEDRLKIRITPQEATLNQELQRRIDEARKRCRIERRNPVSDISPGGSLADRLKAARKRRKGTNTKEGKNRTEQE